MNGLFDRLAVSGSGGLRRCRRPGTQAHLPPSVAQTTARPPTVVLRPYLSVAPSPRAASSPVPLFACLNGLQLPLDLLEPVTPRLETGERQVTRGTGGVLRQFALQPAQLPPLLVLRLNLCLLLGYKFIACGFRICNPACNGVYACMQFATPVLLLPLSPPLPPRRTTRLEVGQKETRKLACVTLSRPYSCYEKFHDTMSLNVI